MNSTAITKNLNGKPEKLLAYFPIIVLPMFAGAARPWLWSGVAGIFLVIFALFLLVSKDLISVRDVRKPLFLLLPILAYPFVQIIPLPLSLISVLSPQRAQWLHRSLDATGVSRWGASLSYVPLDTFMSGLWILTLALFALVLHRSMRDGIIKPGKLLTVLFLVAGLEALYGILQVLVSSAGHGFTEGAHGTFANRNHYAAFLGMIWPLQLVWLWRLDGKNNRTSSFHQKETRRESREKQLFFIFLTGLVLLSLIFSGSRGGIISLCMGTTVLAYFGGRHSRSIVPILIGCWVIILAYGSIIGFEGILNRFAEIEHDAPGRFKIWQFTWKLICDHWLTGTGFGTYRPVIFLYQVFDTDLLQVGAAHCDYLQIASEWGLPCSLLIFFLVWGYWWATARGAAKTSAGEQKPLGTDERLIRVGALAGSAAFLSHVWVEFNWQIPANQLYFVILLVLMRYKEPGSRKHEARSGNQGFRSR
ncbi:MAG: O-antigen ligase family protein [Syntrophobacteraceae bacterium]